MNEPGMLPDPAWHGVESWSGPGCRTDNGRMSLAAAATGVGPDVETVRREIASFQNLWKGGYFEGNPLDPMGASNYGSLGYMSILHATYIACIRPYIKEGETTALEIGPGRGGWTRTMLKAKEVWCLDALSAEHNGFWQYVGRHPHVHYHQVHDFSCSDLPDDAFDYLFSFGCFCHVSFAGIEAYMENLWRKLRSGANAFVMVADYEKYNWAAQNQRALDVRRALAPLAKIEWDGSPLPGKGLKQLDVNEDQEPRPGRWYHAGLERTCRMLMGKGYEVVTPDVGVNFRDVVIHFRKP
jgi:hypothetical protein